MRTLPNSAQRVQDALTAAGASLEVVELPASTRTAAEAAAAIGCSVAQIAKSLVFKITPADHPLLVIASGTNRVNLEAVQQQLGITGQIVKADASFVRAQTGFVIGGVPPVGHDQPLHTLIDQDLLQYEMIWAAAGTPHTVFRLTPQILLHITGGEVVSIV